MFVRRTRGQRLILRLFEKTRQKCIHPRIWWSIVIPTSIYIYLYIYVCTCAILCNNLHKYGVLIASDEPVEARRRKFTALIKLDPPTLARSIIACNHIRRRSKQPSHNYTHYNARRPRRGVIHWIRLELVDVSEMYAAVKANPPPTHDLFYNTRR